VKSLWNEIYKNLEHLASLKFSKCKSKARFYIVEDLTPKLVDKTRNFFDSQSLNYLAICFCKILNPFYIACSILRKINSYKLNRGHGWGLAIFPLTLMQFYGFHMNVIGFK
jgi:hypothetical protein